MNASDARRRVLNMITRPTKETHPYRPDDIYSMSQEIWRDLLCNDNDANEIDRQFYIKDYLSIVRSEAIIHATIDALRNDLTIILADEYSVDWISHQYLENSLCPVHHCDYAACFDDDEDECRVIRQYFPSHDT